MATQYDPSIIQTFADRLYDQADKIVYSYGLLGFLVGGCVGAGIGFSMGTRDFSLLPSVLVGAIAAAFAGAIGRQRAFALRLQAQTALCQAQIEANSSRVDDHGRLVEMLVTHFKRSHFNELTIT